LELGKQNGDDSVFVAPNPGDGHRTVKDFNTGNSATSIANWVSRTNSFKILKQKPKVKGQFLSPLRNRLKIDDSCANNRVKDAMLDPEWFLSEKRPDMLNRGMNTQQLMEKSGKARSISTGPMLSNREGPHRSTVGDLRDQAESMH